MNFLYDYEIENVLNVKFSANQNRGSGKLMETGYIEVLANKNGKKKVLEISFTVDDYTETHQESK